ncbi:hypothetical protein Tco_1265209 [Tanacetum coccineum]
MILRLCFEWSVEREGDDRERELLCLKHPPQAQHDLINLSQFKQLRFMTEQTTPAGDDDNSLFAMHNLPKSVSWLGSHTKSVIAAMKSDVSAHDSEPYFNSGHTDLTVDTLTSGSRSVVNKHEPQLAQMLNGYSRKEKKKAKSKQIRAQNEMGTKSKSQAKLKKLQLEGLKLPNLKLYYKRYQVEGL